MALPRGAEWGVKFNPIRGVGFLLSVFFPVKAPSLLQTGKTAGLTNNKSAERETGHWMPAEASGWSLTTTLPKVLLGGSPQCIHPLSVFCHCHMFFMAFLGCCVCLSGWGFLGSYLTLLLLWAPKGGLYFSVQGGKIQTVSLFGRGFSYSRKGTERPPTERE